MADYHIVIFYSEEDGGYIADVPTLKCCAAFGQTPEKALEEVLIAKKAWLESAKQNGKPVPKPNFIPELYRSQDYCQSPVRRIKSSVTHRAGVHNTWNCKGSHPANGHTKGNGHNRRTQKAR